MRLTFAEVDNLPPCPPLDSPGVEHWRDADGRLVAHAVKAGEFHWVFVPGVATFCFGQDSSETIAVAHSGVTDDHVHDVHRRVVLPAALQALGHEALHASGVLSGHGVLAFCGASGAGKSTLAFALGRQGCSIWADDAVVLEPHRGRVLAVPTPFRLHLRPPVAAFFGPTATPACDERLPSTEPVPLAAIFLLERSIAPAGESPLKLSRLSGADAFVGALRHVNCFSMQDSEQKRRMIDNYLALVASVPVFRLRLASDLGRLAEVAEALTSSVDGALHRPS